MRTRISLILLSLFLICAPVLAQEATQQVTPPPNPTPDPQSALDFISAHPDDVAVLCQHGDTFTHNADQRFPLASVFKVFVLAEAARQIDAGTFDPAESVPLDQVNAYWLPGTDGGAHQKFLDYLGGDRQQITLSEIAYGMIRFSSNAAADYLMARLGSDGYSTLYQMLGVQNSDTPASLLGLVLVLNNHETGAVDLDTLDADTFASESARLADLYVNDTDWRDAERTYQMQQQADQVARATEEPEQAQADSLTAYQQQNELYEKFGIMGTPSDVLKAIAAAYEGDTFSDDAKAFMRQALDWLMDANPNNKDIYSALGVKGGSWAGILTGAWYVQPINGDKTELAVFYRNLPPELWSNWVATGAQQILELRVFAKNEGCSVYSDVLDN